MIHLRALSHPSDISMVVILLKSSAMQVPFQTHVSLFSIDIKVTPEDQQAEFIGNPHKRKQNKVVLSPAELNPIVLSLALICIAL